MFVSEGRLEDADLGLPAIIDDMDISRTAFYEKVKALTNMTPNQYIQELRLAKAKTILEEGEVKTVKEFKKPDSYEKETFLVVDARGEDVRHGDTGDGRDDDQDDHHLDECQPLLEAISRTHRSRHDSSLTL